MTMIQVWADFVCPYSYMAIKNLTRAIERLQLKNINIQIRSFLQYPFVTSKNEEQLSEIISNKYGISEMEAQSYMENVVTLAKEYHVDMNVYKLQPKNTFTAHRLLKLAAKNNKHMQFYDKLSHAYFVEGEILNDDRLLRQLSIEVGLKTHEIEEVLKNSAKYEDEVEFDLIKAQRLHIEGTPVFIFNNELKVVGVKSIKQFGNLLLSLQ